MNKESPPSAAFVRRTVPVLHSDERRPPPSLRSGLRPQADVLKSRVPTVTTDRGAFNEQIPEEQGDGAAHELTRTPVDASIPSPVHKDHWPAWIKQATKELLPIKTKGGSNDIITGESESVLSETFCARAYATTMFSLHFISSSLSAVGVQSLGPLSFRELVSRCSNVREVRENMRHLTRLSIGLRHCKYTDFILDAVERDDMEAVRSIVSSDLHPEMYEDMDLQRKLLRQYASANDPISAHRTLAILMSDSEQSKVESFNVLLQAYLIARERDWDLIVKLVDDMHAHDIGVSQETLQQILSSVLTGSQPTYAPGRRRVEIGKAGRLLLKIQRNHTSQGGIVPLEAWNRLLHHHGRNSQLDELDDLSLALASMGTQAHGSLKLTEEKQYTSDVDRLGYAKAQPLVLAVFNPNTQFWIVSWAFVASKFNQEVFQRHNEALAWAQALPRGVEAIRRQFPYTRGLALLRVLNKSYGLPVGRRVLQQAISHQLRRLFPDSLTREMLASRNPRAYLRQMRSLGRSGVTMKQMVSRLNAVWGTPIFKVPDWVLEYDEMPEAGAPIEKLFEVARREQEREAALRDIVFSKERKGGD